MTGRERVEAAFSPDGAREVPVVFPYEGIFVRDHWSQFTSRPWWQMHSPRLEDQVGWRRDLFAEAGVDWFDLPHCPPKRVREETRVEERDGKVYLVSVRTGRKRELRSPVVSGDWIAPGGHLADAERPRSREDVDALLPRPGAGEPDLSDGRGDLATRMLREFGNDMLPCGRASGPLWSACGLWGFEDAMEKTVENPDLMDYACRRATEYAVAEVREAAALGCRVVWIEDCWTDLVSAEAFAALNVRNLRKITEAVGAAGMKSVHYFCGNPAGRLDLIFDAGADAYAFEESKKGFRIDIGAIAERLGGRAALLGNLDALGVLPNGSETDLRAAIREQLAVGRKNRNRFIMSLGSPVTPGTPPQRVRLYRDLTRELGSR